MMGMFKSLIYLAILVALIASVWKVFEKAGEPGWAALIPLYNAFVMLKIVGKPWWWLLLMLIPLIGLIIAFIVTMELAKKFSQGTGFAIGLFFLPFVFYPILGFGDARYQR